MVVAAGGSDGLAQDVAVLAGALVSMSVLVGLAVRFVLVPYLRDHLVRPVQETHRQVTPHPTRAHEDIPTIVDRLDDLTDAVNRLGDTTVAVQAVANAAARTAAGLTRRLSHHEQWSDIETSRLWSRLAAQTPDEREEDPP